MSVDPNTRRPARSSAGASTVTSLRQRNKGAVLKQIILAGETTRAALASDCGLSMASATNMVTELTGEGLVEETGLVSSHGGRPISLLAPRADSAYTLGVDVGERGVAVELFDFRMNRVDREFSGGAEPETAASIVDDLNQAVFALHLRNPHRWDRLLGIGLGLPGLVETEADGVQVLYAQSLGWPAIPISELIRGDLPVFADNGAKAQTKAELWFGAARGVNHALVALLGRGVGLGIITDGALTHGAAGSAGEWGHTKVQVNGRLCRCGSRGCVEAYLGADAILAEWEAAGGQFEGTGWRALGDLLDAAEKGDRAAGLIVTSIVDTLGAAVGSMVNLTNPERVVVGGWVGNRLMEGLRPRIEQSIRTNALARPGSQFTLHTSSFGGDTVALGSALMPIEALIQSPNV
ncbi:ROK family protein [Cryobacterium sp. 10S3]|uniref:ROK family protein n=1 Tax=unclassified Cryobacterium TaxID=2649013 RepID=UPI002AC98CFB|nr:MULTISPECIES: ROK family protein [unclassified Cryobacterium]MEB0001666.1 ROK family protein [Cryobacterium sp. RTC2.1]MEB0286697.1 ROK family protein [Cryobacterium sp. 10S3]WPX13182.1 ROK family protein [Cryobacterium sp. 10S3]